MIYRLSADQKFYTRYSKANYDSLYFYGPDYHNLRFKVSEQEQATKVYFQYSGYHGFRSKPPHKQFIQKLNDSLKLVFKAEQLVIKDISNEKKHDQTTR